MLLEKPELDAVLDSNGQMKFYIQYQPNSSASKKHLGENLSPRISKASRRPLWHGNLQRKEPDALNNSCTLFPPSKVQAIWHLNRKILHSSIHSYVVFNIALLRTSLSSII